MMGAFEAEQHVSAHGQALRMDWQVMLQIEACIGDRFAEHGGVLGGHRTDGVVRTFHFDCAARRSAATYSPDTASLRRLFQQDWNPQGINMLGFVHSHPPGIARPSGGDLVYAERILAVNPSLARLLLPIVVSSADTGAFELVPYAAVRDACGGVRAVALTLILGTFSAIETSVELPADGNRGC